jgi:hypothetical protein
MRVLTLSKRCDTLSGMATGKKNPKTEEQVCVLHHRRSECAPYKGHTFWESVVLVVLAQRPTLNVGEAVEMADEAHQKWESRFSEK